MIITRTPFRISFFGGGTDYPAYYHEHGGLALSATINRYCYITCRKLPPFFDFRYRLRYSSMQLAKTLDEIEHPSIRECIRFMGVEDGLEVTHTGDIPAMSGIGSSSAFTVGLLHALHALKGEMVTRRRLLFDAIQVEQNILKENVGSQDQTAAAFGGLNRIRFGGAEEVFVEPLIMDASRRLELQNSLFLYFTGFSRLASEITREQIRLIPEKLTELKQMKEMVDEGIAILHDRQRPLEDFGRLLHESWKLKRSLSSSITNDNLDAIYEAGLKAGATGGKICGAGGGGFMLFYVVPDRQPEFREKMKHLLQVPFRFDTLGSHIVFYST